MSAVLSGLLICITSFIVEIIPFGPINFSGTLRLFSNGIYVTGFSHILSKSRIIINRLCHMLPLELLLLQGRLGIVLCYSCSQSIELCELSLLLCGSLNDQRWH